jgi:hypothetical protein
MVQSCTTPPPRSYSTGSTWILRCCSIRFVDPGGPAKLLSGSRSGQGSHRAYLMSPPAGFARRRQPEQREGAHAAPTSLATPRLARGTDFVKMLVQHRESGRTSCWSVGELLGDALTATLRRRRHRSCRGQCCGGEGKASMLRRYCARLGVAARDVAAFGDMPNDVAMLSWAGMPYVVANAPRCCVGASSRRAHKRRVRRRPYDQGWLAR